jgi:hypothetical protein
MAFIYVTEYSDVGGTRGGAQVVAPFQSADVVEQQVAVGMASVQSAPFKNTTRFVMINTDAACSLAFGTNPTAVTTAHRLAANETRFYAVQGGTLVAVIENT